MTLLDPKDRRRCEGVFVGGYRDGQPCTYPATWWIAGVWQLLVCGHHAKGFSGRIRQELDR